MELKDQIRISAPRERVFAALNDPEVLREAIPGCESLEAVGDDGFEATVSSKVGPLKARFKGQVRLEDVVPGESYTLVGEGRGGPAGHAKIRSQVKLADDGPNATLLSYDVKADIGGKLAQLGGHLVEKTSKKLSAEFFERFESIVTGGDAADGGEDAEPAARAAAPNRTALYVVLALAAAALIAWLVL